MPIPSFIICFKRQISPDRRHQAGKPPSENFFSVSASLSFNTAQWDCGLHYSTMTFYLLLIFLPFFFTDAHQSQIWENGFGKDLYLIDIFYSRQKLLQMQTRKIEKLTLIIGQFQQILQDFGLIIVMLQMFSQCIVQLRGLAFLTGKTSWFQSLNSDSFFIATIVIFNSIKNTEYYKEQNLALMQQNIC